MATLASATFRDPAFNSQFQIHRSQSTMEADCYQHSRTCHKSQVYVDKVHIPQVPLNVLTTPWPFAMRGIDMIGEIRPTASNGHHFILVAIDYFTKWVEATSFSTVTKKVMARFSQHNLICRYGVPERIITDNGTVIGGSGTDCFKAGSRNVAVSKSRHRLLFSPNGKDKSTEKFLKRDCSRFGR